MNLCEYMKKNVILTCVNGQVFQGKADWYSPPQDNVDNIETICIGDYEFCEDEIKSIEIIG